MSITEPRFPGFWLWLVLCIAPAALHAGPRVTDDAGRTVELSEPAGRIVSLAPSMTELLFSIGAGQQIVGVMAHSDFPADARQLPVVGQHDGLDLERILALEPDLVIAWQSGNPRGALRRLESLGYPVYIAEPASLDAIARQLTVLGSLVGRERTGQREADAFRQELADLRSTYSSRASVDVFYQVWNEPLITVGGRELIHDMITTCGGDNIFSDLPVGPKVSVESVLQRRPEVIIGSGSGPERPAWLDDWLRWDRLPAVRNGWIHHVDPDIVQRHSLRALQGTRTLCSLIDRAR